MSPARPSSPLDEKVLLIEEALSQARLPHAFGGAIAFGYYGTPRGTVDIDINLFLPTRDAEAALAVLARLGVQEPDARARKTLLQDGQVRLAWEHTPLDLFFSYDPLHESCLERRQRVPFGRSGREIFILSAEDLAIFKVIFARDKDWTDLREMLFAQGDDFDAGYAVHWLRRILPQDDARYVRFDGLLRE